MWLCFLVKKERLISCTTESPVASKQYVTRHCTTILWHLISNSGEIWPELKAIIIHMYVETLHQIILSVWDQLRVYFRSSEGFAQYWVNTFLKNIHLLNLAGRWNIKKQLVRHGVPGQCMSSTCNVDSNKIIGIGASFIIIIIIIIIMIILFVHKDKKNNTHNDYRLPQALKHFLRDI